MCCTNLGLGDPLAHSVATPIRKAACRGSAAASSDIFTSSFAAAGVAVFNLTARATPATPTVVSTTGFTTTADGALEIALSTATNAGTGGASNAAMDDGSAANLVPGNPVASAAIATPQVSARCGSTTAAGGAATTDSTITLPGTTSLTRAPVSASVTQHELTPSRAQLLRSNACVVDTNQHVVWRSVPPRVQLVAIETTLEVDFHSVADHASLESATRAFSAPTTPREARAHDVSTPPNAYLISTLTEFKVEVYAARPLPSSEGWGKRMRRYSSHVVDCRSGWSLKSSSSVASEALGSKIARALVAPTASRAGDASLGDSGRA